ncbi:MAG: lipid A biosynthesis acyltransferase [Gammaproteobacteria bacterium]|nr:lipid A biosynthesis acyltransferase [Gammaproteobacteria bacterium]
MKIGEQKRTKKRTNSSEQQWKETEDRGSSFMINLIIWIILHLGRRVGRLFLYPIVFYFVISSKTRRYSRAYLQRNFTYAGKSSPNIIDIFRHYYAFSNMLLDRVYFLTGKSKAFDITLYNEEILLNQIQSKQGVVLLGSHHGNFDALRALAQQHENVKVKALMYNNDHQKINIAFEKLNPDLKNEVIEVGQPDSMIKVQAAYLNGTVIGMLADRVEHDNRTVECQFMGKSISFPSGPLLVAHLLKAPVILCFALHREANKYDIYFHLLSEKVELHRNNREEQIQKLMQQYVNTIEQHCIDYPYNWFNFYDFWSDEKAV